MVDKLFLAILIIGFLGVILVLINFYNGFTTQITNLVWIEKNFVRNKFLNITARKAFDPNRTGNGISPGRMEIYWLTISTTNA